MTKFVNTIIIFFALFLFSCASNTQILDRYNNGQKKLIREYKIMKSGVNVDSATTRIFKYYPNGMRFYEQDIFDNEPNGKYRSWYPSGKKFAVGNYINGELFGKWSWYGDDGFLDSVRTYNEDILNGVYIDYFNNGKPQIIIGYLSNI